MNYPTFRRKKFDAHVVFSAYCHLSLHRIIIIHNNFQFSSFSRKIGVK